MPIELKRFGERDIVSAPDQFHIARLRLSFLYAALLAGVLAFSSIIIYVGFSQRLEFDHDHSARDGYVSGGTISRSPDDETSELLSVLLISNGFLLVVGSGLSYWLAGRTLLPIRESYDQQKRFLADASHELRTPLTVLKTNTENLIYRAQKNGEMAPEMQINLQEIDRMGDMVRSLLTLSHLEELAQRPQFVPLDLVPILGDVTDRLVPIAQAHQITLQDTVKNTTSIMVLANKEMLIQALSNIIKNAILYNQEKGSVVISTELKHGVVTIIVQDTGVGIAAHDLEHIFERFYRADRSRSRVSGGSGLGLAITKSIIASFGGSIRITSALHKGTTVSITLPLAD